MTTGRWEKHHVNQVLKEPGLGTPKFGGLGPQNTSIPHLNFHLGSTHKKLPKQVICENDTDDCWPARSGDGLVIDNLKWDILKKICGNICAQLFLWIASSGVFSISNIHEHIYIRCHGILQGTRFWTIALKFSSPPTTSKTQRLFWDAAFCLQLEASCLQLSIFFNLWALRVENDFETNGTPGARASSGVQTIAGHRAEQSA